MQQIRCTSSCCSSYVASISASELAGDIAMDIETHLDDIVAAVNRPVHASLKPQHAHSANGFQCRSDLLISGLDTRV